MLNRDPAFLSRDGHKKETVALPIMMRRDVTIACYAAPGPHPTAFESAILPANISDRQCYTNLFSSRNLLLSRMCPSTHNSRQPSHTFMRFSLYALGTSSEGECRVRKLAYSSQRYVFASQRGHPVMSTFSMFSVRYSEVRPAIMLLPDPILRVFWTHLDSPAPSRV